MKRLAVVVLVGACGTTEAPPVPASHATGQVEAWAAGPDLPVPRANHCSVAIGDLVVVIGGNHAVGDGFATIDEIDVARVGEDGTLGAWTVAGHTPSPVSECTAASDGRRLYLLDGLYDDEADRGQVFAADLDDGGTLGALVPMGALPDGVVAISSEATVANGELLVMHTELPDAGDTTVTLRSPLSGTLAWTVDDWQIGFRAQAQYAFAPGFALVLGGYGTGTDGNPVLDETFAAPLDGGAVIPGAPLPSPVSFGEAAVADDWVFVAGGRAQVFGAGGTTDVFAAQLGADGTLGAWQVATSLPVPRTNHEMVRVGDFLVITGGAGSGPGDATVLVARVKFPAD